ncbi:uncharacterized protein BDV17DRAFT_291627 [Aspergillus undulatus]|uniref:uncharacterized protein n=1 Tax=Aspergillus undulatus TaxID=1810928 RepID=UPI003CCD4107
MCHVQRVTNTCGHVNDHVLMACHLAKSATPSPESSPTSCTFPTTTLCRDQKPKDMKTRCSSRERQGQNTKEIRGKNQGRNESSTQGQAHASEEKKVKAIAAATTSEKEDKGDYEYQDMIQREGFDARTGPYCKLKVPRILPSPCGFKCMVFGCGKAD